MTPITMDGDLYQMRLPNVFEWHRVKKYINISRGDCIPIQHRLHDWVLIMSHHVAEKMYGKQIDGNTKYLFRIDRDGAHVVKRSEFVATVFCLVPLDKNGSSIEHAFGIENPDGTLATGGFWSHETNNLYDTKEGEDPIRWIVCDGKLFMQSPTYYDYVEKLEELLEFF